MTEPIRSELISRRTAFSLIGVAVPIVILTAREAAAQTPGMERREERREDRQDRREERRDDRLDRREERRDERSGVVPVPPATTGSTGTSSTGAPK
jgi:hypothetical protein